MDAKMKLNICWIWVLILLLQRIKSKDVTLLKVLIQILMSVWIYVDIHQIHVKLSFKGEATACSFKIAVRLGNHTALVEFGFKKFTV